MPRPAFSYLILFVTLARHNGGNQHAEEGNQRKRQFLGKGMAGPEGVDHAPEQRKEDHEPGGQTRMARRM